MLLFLLACLPSGDPGPAPSGTRSAELAQRAAEVSRRADALAEQARDLEGMFDELREAPAGTRGPIRDRIQARSAELQAEARALRDEVADIEAASRVY